MAMLLTFTPQKSAKPHPGPVPGVSASIIIFPGVRYERPGLPDRVGQHLVTTAKPKPKPVQY